MPKRKYNWTAELLRVVETRRRTPFVWGSHDCALFVCDCLQAMMEDRVDFAREFRGKYNSEQQAKDLIGQPLGAVVERIAKEYGFEEVLPLMAQIGDPVLFTGILPDGREEPTLGICLGQQIAAAMPDGIMLHSIYKVNRAWRFS